MKKDTSAKKPAAAQGIELEALLRENETLAQQVKRLIRAEGKLYEYQQELDAQLKEYKGLYELNRKINGTFSIENIYQQTLAYVIQDLEFERAVFLRRSEPGNYSVCAFDGYYDPAQKKLISELTMERGAPCVAPLIAGREYVICHPGSTGPQEGGCRAKLCMDEFFVYPLGHHATPHVLLIVGNTAEGAEFHRRVDETPGSLFSMGNMVGLVSSLIDNQIFFERMMQAREQERLAEARYRGIFENSAEGIFQRTPEGGYVDANPALARMLGYASPEELMTAVTDIGRQLYVDPGCHDDLIRRLETQGRAEGFECRVYRKDRKIIWVSLSMRAVRDSEGRVQFYEGMCEEITQRKMAEDALRESEQKYRQLSEVLEQRVQETVAELRQKDKILILQGRQAVMGEMLSNIAHQWRQPLNILALLVQDLQMTQKKGVLSEEFIDANVKRTMEIILQLSKTIDDFRYFFKPDQEKLLFRVIEPVEKVLSLLEGSFTAHGIRTEVMQTGDAVIDGFLTEFTQVLLNVLMNARDALITSGVPAPLIGIRLFTEGGRTVVTIADNAGGIPEEIKDKIFEPYFTTKGPEQGTGIGLFMCKTIIEKSMHGRLSVRNAGGGAEFRIEV